MPRQFSLAHLTVLGCTPPELIHIAEQTGYDCVSLRIIPLGSPSYDLANDAPLRRATKAALVETGLPVLDIELARILPDVDVRDYKPAFEVAAELGAKHVISSIWTPDPAVATDKLMEMCDIAAPLGLTINLEYLPFVPIGRFSDILAIHRAAGRANCGLLVDALYSTAYDPAELDALPRHLFNFIHLNDGPKVLPTLGTPEMFEVVREGRLYVGDGEIDLAGLLRRLPQVPCSLELPNAAMVKAYGYAEHARRCLEKAKRFVAERVDGAVAWAVGMPAGTRATACEIHAQR
jgi:sugar phosphate isomerase/epimerase